ncbi:MAG: mechanosensitive ion channel domain-containing protein [Candidatus Peribacteraceae bacterium]
MDALFSRLTGLMSDAWAEAHHRFIDIVPEALLAIFVVLIGWLVATILQILVLRVLRFFAIDKLAGKTPLERLLKDIGVKRGLTDILGLLVFWLAILITLTVASDIVKLTQVSRALTIVTGYIPQAIAALLIIVFGMLLARFLQVLTIQALKRAEIVGDRVAGKAVYIIVFIFVGFAAMEQLGIRLDFVTTNAIILISSTIVLLGIALIVGARSLIEGWLLTQYLTHELHTGDHVTIDDVSGEVVRISHVAVVLKTSKGEQLIPSKSFVEKGYSRTSKA